MSARTHAHQIPQAVNHTFNDARGTRPWLRGKELMLSMTGKPLNGKLCLTRIMLRSTNMQQQDWLRSTPTRSVISTRRPPETKGVRPNSTRSSLSNTVASLGKNLSTDGNHTEVDTNAVLVGKESTKPSLPQQLKNDWNRCALNFSLRPAIPSTTAHTSQSRKRAPANLLAKQTNQQSDSQHTLEETKGYLKCANCGNSVHKRTNEDAFQAFVQGPMHQQALRPAASRTCQPHFVAERRSIALQEL